MSKHYYGDDFPIGSVVYYVDRHGWNIEIKFGIVSENRTSEIYAELLDWKRFGEKIDGVPVEDFVTPTKWKKMPKGWGYDTELFHHDFGEPAKELYDLDMRDPDNILMAYKNGWLVEREKIDYCKFESDIDRNKGWRIVRKYDKYVPTYVHLPANKFYQTFEEADKVRRAELNELERQKSLTDEEWSIEQIEKSLNKWQILGANTADVESAREMLMSLDHIEDVETRVVGGCLEWKRTKNKRWGAVK